MTTKTQDSHPDTQINPANDRDRPAEGDQGRNGSNPQGSELRLPREDVLSTEHQADAARKALDRSDIRGRISEISTSVIRPNKKNAKVHSEY